jgi:hypothetical protein
LNDFLFLVGQRDLAEKPSKFRLDELEALDEK